MLQDSREKLLLYVPELIAVQAADAQAFVDGSAASSTKAAETTPRRDCPMTMPATRAAIPLLFPMAG
ncbi:hypothetical protein [Sphingomonas sp. KR3-1]|uniref:hypothetical protein n=1 Tax=Sphingomonas sp. KR3-1 TaxID=3156611 RepID=UPI0032B47F42